MEISISGPGIVSVNSEELVKTPEAQRQIKAAHGLDKSLRKQVSEIESLRATISRLEAELAACREDAERYRWLREHWDDVNHPVDFIICNSFVTTLDADVDAARKGEVET